MGFESVNQGNQEIEIENENPPMPDVRKWSPGEIKDLRDTLEKFGVQLKE